MYVVRHRKTKEVVHISHLPVEKGRQPKEVYPGFNGRTMEIGYTTKNHIPAEFKINKSGELVPLTLKEKVDAGLPVVGRHQKLVKGEIVDKPLADLVKEKIISLDDLKAQMVTGFSQMAFAKRRKLIPDYKLENASLGVYDDGREADYRATILAFRDEYKRVETLVQKAKEVMDLVAIKVKYPEKIIKAGNS